MELSKLIITQIIHDYKESKGITKLAKEYGMTYKDMRTLLKQNGVEVIRGRKRGGGIGQCTEVNGNKIDRRKAWQLRKIEQGLCTSCGGPNDSESIYHCKKCLKKRTEAKKRDAQ